MILRINKSKRIISIKLLIIFLFNIWGNQAYGMPGGPSQPEFSGFSPISNTEMVNKFTGTFNYNLPLLDVGGYPINLVYDAAVSNESDASWVGLGWNLNTGCINRNKRGLPDDFHGDEIQKKYDRNAIKRYGLSLGAGAQFFNSIGLTLKGGVYYSSVTGWGSETSFGKSLGIPLMNKGSMNGSIGITQNTSSSTDGGVTNSINVGVSMGKSFKTGESGSMGLNLGASYGETSNSRQGMMQQGWKINLDAKAKNGATDYIGSKKIRENGIGGHVGGLSFSKSFIDPTYTPTIEVPFNNDAFTLNLKAGGDFCAIDGNGTLDGYAIIQDINVENLNSKGYGYIYSDSALDKSDRLMDFNREKDVPFHLKVPNMAIPHFTYDLFQINDHQHGGQFRAYRNDIGILRDRETKSTKNDFNLGLEGHFGNVFEAGLTLDFVDAVTSTYPNIENDFKRYDFNPNSPLDNPVKENFYFKKSDDVFNWDEEFHNKINGFGATNVHLNGDGSRASILESKTGAYSHSTILQKNQSGDYNKVGTKYERPNLRNTYINFLDFTSKGKYGLDKSILSYSTNSSSQYLSSNPISYDLPNKKLIAEFDVINPDGSKYIYGIPVLNKIQEDYAFSIPSSSSPASGLVYFQASQLNSANKNTKDGFYNKDITPVYAHSWLLTNILSPDYQDLTNNGLTEDDRGNGIRFNYTKADYDFSWRNPVEPNLTAGSNPVGIHNKGVEYTPDDDKAIVTYGEREDWYSHSIESKSMIAFFITSSRNDCNSLDRLGKIVSGKGKQKLDEIRVYSKAEINNLLRQNNNTLSRATLFANATPIKSVKFNYDYSLCQGNPTNTGSQNGKLTLTSIHILSGKNLNPVVYKFEYGSTSDDNPGYNAKNIDRWGNYKAMSNNNQFAPGKNLNNDQFPYVIQDKTLADKNSQAWLLKTITLPSGGTIKVDYESHDYSFVQHKRTSQMYKIIGFGSSSTSALGKNELYSMPTRESNHYIFFETTLPSGSYSKSKIKELFFEDLNDYGSDKYLFYKVRCKLDPKSSAMEYLPGYGEIEDYNQYGGSSNGKLVVWVKLKSTTITPMPLYPSLKIELNPVARNSWQFIRDNVQKLAWDGFLNDDADAFDVIKSLASNVAKIFTGEDQFEIQAMDRRLAQTVELGGSSFVRAYVPTATKLGGNGSRVRKLTIADNWSKLIDPTGSALSPDIKPPVGEGEYVYEYDYKLKDKNDNDISSGVATYEPLIGGEENSWRQPIFYEGQFAPGAPSSEYSIEKPFNENIFPSPSIGYSKIKITANRQKSAELNTGNGFKTNEFYTAKDFPVTTDYTELNSSTIRRDKNELSFDLLGFFSSHHDDLSVSQGYSITLNDMHGKPKSEKSFKYGQNEYDAPLSYTKYYYRNDNKLPVADETGAISLKDKGIETEFFTDSRFQVSNTSDINVNPGGGFFIVFPFTCPVCLPIPWFLGNSYFSTDENSIKMTSTNKVTSKSFAQYKTESSKDGAIVTSENLAWDDKTGAVVLSKMNNEYGKTYYNFNMPAYWKYKDLGHAYKAMDMTLKMETSTANNTSKDICITPSGSVFNNAGYLKSGDEVFIEEIVTSGTPPLGAKYHYIANVDVPASASILNFFIDILGNALVPSSATALYKVKVLRTAAQNQQSANAESITAMDPIASSTSINTSYTKLISGSATQMKDDWPIILKANEYSNGSGSLVASINRNPYIWGAKGDWKQVASLSPLGNKTGLTRAGELPNLAMDATLKDNPSSTLASYHRNSTAGWDTKNENTLYDSKGNLVEDLSRITKWGWCLGSGGSSNSGGLMQSPNTSSKNSGESYRVPTSGGSNYEKIPLISNRISVKDSLSLADTFPSNLMELPIEEIRKYLPISIRNHPYYILAKRESNLKLVDPNYKKTIDIELKQLIKDKYSEYLSLVNVSDSHKETISEIQFNQSQMYAYAAYQQAYENPSTQYRSDDATTTDCNGDGSFENSTTLSPSDWIGRYIYDISTACNDDPDDGLAYFIDPNLNQVDPDCGTTDYHYKIVSSGFDPIVGGNLLPMSHTGNKAMRLGNPCDFDNGEAISKRFTITSANSNISFWYACVIQNPSHSSCDNPVFGVRLFVGNSNTAVTSGLNISGTGSSYVNPNVSVAGFFHTANSGTLIYSDWHCGSIDLSSYIGQSVSLEFYTKDCKLGAHYGYAYIDDFVCSGGCSTPGSFSNFRKENCEKICVDYSIPSTTNNSGTSYGTTELTLNIYDVSNTLFNTITISKTGNSTNTQTYCFEGLVLPNGGSYQFTGKLFLPSSSSPHITFSTQSVPITNCHYKCCKEDSIFSITKFGYNRTLPIIVTSNGKYKEVDFCSFEEIEFMNRYPSEYDGVINPNMTSCMSGSTNQCLSSISHTGTKSLAVSSGSGVYESIFNVGYGNAQNDYTQLNTSNTVALSNKNSYPLFNPELGKTYKLSFWIKVDPQDQIAASPMKISALSGASTWTTISNTGAFLTGTIEGWRLYEAKITIPSASISKIKYEFLKPPTGNGWVRYFDDIRFIPDDAQAKTYVYDDKSLKIVSELDENHFATFYDYNESGNLIRIRKETEKGIVTLKENNFNYQK